ncbi:MAG: hypothetical protein JWN98_2388 [Abditibacteriota bacterium]|nr:hypothetical protein [Abditibacteriota bacterium]
MELYAVANAAPLLSTPLSLYSNTTLPRNRIAHASSKYFDWNQSTLIPTNTVLEARNMIKIVEHWYSQAQTFQGLTWPVPHSEAPVSANGC